MQREISRIYATAGITASFDNSKDAVASYYTVLLDKAPTSGGSSSPDSLGYTTSTNGAIDNRGAIYKYRISDYSSERQSALRALGQHPINLGTAIGRVLGHEVGHFLLQMDQKHHSPSGLMRPQFRGDSSLYMGGGNFDFTKDQVKILSDLCKPKTPVP